MVSGSQLFMRRFRSSVYHSKCSRRKCLAAAVLISIFLLLIHVCVLRRKTAPTVYIVEEHHEALSYWFYAAYEGLIPKEGNVLIHIDGHSDESTPEFVPGMPLFQYPQNDQEVSYFLQKNDIFVQSAVITGLLSRFIWVWPSWDKRFMEQKQRYESSLVELGWFWEEFDAGGGRGGREPHFCQCETPQFPPVEPLSKRCSFLNSTVATAEQQLTIIPAEFCQIERHYISEHVNEEHFVEKISEDVGWLRDDENVIYDVDEDFFGCENVGNVLTENGPAWSVVESLDEQLKEFLCPKYITHEDIGNRFLKLLLQPFIKRCESVASRNLCTGAAGFTRLMSNAYGDLVSEFRRHPSLFCGRNDFDVRNSWLKLAKIFYKMPAAHVKKVYDLGFCLSTTPKTLYFDVGRAEFTLCHGLNQANSTIVFLHSPDRSEIMEHGGSFLRMTRAVFRRRPFSLVTVCRSVRDGFTPRQSADLIESEILETLKRVTDERGKIHYDDDLLGGRMGWKSRH